MLSVALIVFREVVEIALIVSVVIAASKGRAGRGLWTCIGLAGGAAGAGMVAAFAGALTSAAEGMGQEIFNALVLFAAATLMSVSSPLPDAVTRSTGIGAVLSGSAARSAVTRDLTASASAGLSGP